VERTETRRSEIFSKIQITRANYKNIDPYIRNQLKRASISAVINIAEGSGKFSKADK
jgi:four helix bundle protein